MESVDLLPHLKQCNIHVALQNSKFDEEGEPHLYMNESSMINTYKVE